MYSCEKKLFLQITINTIHMKELVEKISEVYNSFEKDAQAQIENGNKAAGTRARKSSLELEKLMKEFRKLSLESSKN